MKISKSISRVGAFSIVSSLYILFFLIWLNATQPIYPWVVFCIPAFVIYPLAVCRPQWMANKVFAFGLSAAVIAYYTFLNVFLAPGHPWVVYIAFAVAWYPFSMLFAKKNAFAFSLFGLVWSVLFFTLVNRITTPNTIWAVYPIFSVLWWPMSVYFFAYKKESKNQKN